MTSGFFETTNTGSSTSTNNQGQNTATSTSNAFSFGTPEPTSAFGGGTSVMMSANGLRFATPSTRSAFSEFGSLFEQPKVQTPGVTPPSTSSYLMSIKSTANPDPPPVTMGTSTPTYSVFSEKDPSNPTAVLQYQTISVTPAYRGTSLEELRVQDYEQNRGPRLAECIHGSSPGSSAIRATSLSETETVTPQLPNNPTIGAAASTSMGSTQSVSNGVSAFGKPPQKPNAGTSRALVPASGLGTTFDQPGMLDPGKPEYIEELLKKLFLGEELVDIRFHLFSAKSSTSRRVMKPRVLCANSAILVKSSKYFLDLMAGDVCPSDPSLVDLGDDDVPSGDLFDDYGYGSDSDLEDFDVPLRIANPEVPGDWSLSNDYEELSDDGSESVCSDMYFTSSEQLSEDDSFTVDKVGNGVVATSEARIRETVHNDELGNQSVTRSSWRSFKRSRDIFVTDTAFRTWYTLLNYVHAHKFSFFPLTSTTPGGECRHSGSYLDVPSCSAKSMYRLASKVGLDHLRDEARSYILSNLNEHNILKELSCSLVSKYPQLREMELDVLYSHIASPSVVTNFGAFAKRIAQELPHGVDIIVGIHTRLLKAHHPFALKLESPAPTPPPLASGLSESGPEEEAKLNVHASDAPEPEAQADAGPSHLVQPSTRSDCLPSRSGAASASGSAPGAQVQPEPPQETALSTTSGRRNTAGGKRGGKRKK